MSESDPDRESSPGPRSDRPGEQPQPEPRPGSEKAQRLRLRFARVAEASSIGHLDLSRTWERAFREAGIAVSYSQGNRPQPRITIGAGLPRGVTSTGELLDVILAKRLPPVEMVERVRPHLPPGLDARDAREVGMGLPSLPSAVRWADYELELPAAQDGPDAAAAVESLMEAERFPWEDTRGQKVRRYDLRPLVQEVRVLPAAASASSAETTPSEAEERGSPTDSRSGGGVTRLWMRLRCDPRGVGRPDQVAMALGLSEPLRIHRHRLVLAEVSPARDAWRRRGRFAG